MAAFSSEYKYDVIIIGAGSVGVPTALSLSQAGLKVLVLEQLPSVGQASNKHAIGGIRATHSDPAKIYLCTRSLDHFSHWEEKYGDDIEWYKGGYSFVAYREQEKETLLSLLKVQQSFGLNISWLERENILKIMPDLNPDGLLGGTFSPDDGSASPLKSAYAFYKQAVLNGVIFRFNEKIIKILIENDRVTGVQTENAEYHSRYVINAAGSWAADFNQDTGIQIPVKPDAHEAGVTEPVIRLFDPMVVDIRPRQGSSNFYFYQHANGKIIFCITPNPQIWGNLSVETSEFLPLAARRLIEIMPKLRNIRVRRTWRGTYPMTPDGSPIIGEVDELQGYLLAVGMCGQGFMLGPGVAELLSHLILGSLVEEEKQTLKALSLYREFANVEKLK